MVKQSTLSGGIFGLDCKREESRIVLTPVPWEVTTSYGGGTSLGPDAILKASIQIDLFDERFGDAYEAGYFWDRHDFGFKTKNDELKPVAQQVIREWEETGALKHSTANISKVNAGCEAMVQAVYKQTQSILKNGQIPAIVGGDHSTPLGAIKALCEAHKDEIGILHIDAHADLRLAYEGFTYSHASIMRNVCLLKSPPKKLVQVAIRDYCDEEAGFIRDNEGRIQTFFDHQLKRELFSGRPWQAICEQIIGTLPKKVYVSFDIDGLSPEFCPSTGTPVPGGISYDQVGFLLETLGRSGRTIVGFDLNEVAPGETEWDANVGARILFQLCGWAIKTNS